MGLHAMKLQAYTLCADVNGRGGLELGCQQMFHTLYPCSQ